VIAAPRGSRTRALPAGGSVCGRWHIRRNLPRAVRCPPISTAHAEDTVLPFLCILLFADSDQGNVILCRRISSRSPLSFPMRCGASQFNAEARLSVSACALPQLITACRSIQCRSSPSDSLLCRGSLRALPLPSQRFACFAPPEQPRSEPCRSAADIGVAEPLPSKLVNSKPLQSVRSVSMPWRSSPSIAIYADSDIPLRCCAAPRHSLLFPCEGVADHSNSAASHRSFSLYM